MTSYITHIVSTKDTLEQLAYKYLGTYDTSSIISANNLRYPFISDDVKDQYALYKGYVLPTLIDYLDTTQNTYIETSNTQNIQVAVGDTLLLTGPNGASIAGTITKITLTSGTYRYYVNVSIPANVQGEIGYIYGNQSLVSTRVAKTGDTLIIPLDGQVQSVTNAPTNFYGTDIQLDQNGFIIKSKGDFSTVSGVSNVQQAAVLRAKTPLGTLPGDEDNSYGNRSFEAIGESNMPYFWDLVRAFTAQSVANDPRIETVDAITVTADPNSPGAADISLQVSPVDLSDNFSVGFTFKL